MKHTGSKRARIIALRRQHPQWPPVKIARAVGSRTNYVRQVLSECDLGGVVSLGRAALAAGLTIRDIRALANRRSAA